MRNKLEEIANFRQERQSSQTVEDIHVRVHEKTGVVVGRFTISGTFAGLAYNLAGRFTDVWVKRNGSWQLVSAQNTSLPEMDTTKVPPDSFFVAMEKEDWEALKNKDKAAATRLLADDFVGMYDFGFFNKAEWIKQIDGQYTIDAYTIEDPKVLRPSPTTALLLYRSTCKGTGEWAEYCSHTQYISDLMVHRNGKWEDLFSQDTIAVPATSARASGSAGSDEVAAGGGSAGEQSDKTLVDTIVGLEKSLWEDNTPGPSTSDRLLAEDLEIIKHGHRFTKAEDAKEFGNVHTASFAMEDLHAKVLSPEVVLLTYRVKASWKGPYRGKEMASLPPRVLWVSSVWTKREQQWVNVLFEENLRDEFY